MLQSAFCRGDTSAKCLNITQVFKHGGYVWVAVICNAWMPEVLNGDIPVWPARAMDFNSCKLPQLEKRHLGATLKRDSSGDNCVTNEDLRDGNT